MATYKLPENAVRWLYGGEKGNSSKVMFSAITGLPTGGTTPKTPKDPDDFKRCMLLIDEVPEFESELHKVAALSPVWKNIVDNWVLLCIMMDATLDEWETGNKTGATKKQYDFMKSLGC